MNNQRQRRGSPLRPRKRPPIDIDPKAFWAAFTDARDKAGKTLGQIGIELDITNATFTRMRYAAEDIDPRYRPNLQTYLTLCWWMGQDPARFMVDPDGLPVRQIPRHTGS